MVQTIISPLTVIGEKIGKYWVQSQRPETSVVLLEIHDNSFSSCVITTENNTFRLGDFRDGSSHQLDSLYQETESLSDKNYAWWKLCFYHNGERFRLDDYCQSLPISEDSSTNIGAFIARHTDELLATFSFLSHQTFVVMGDYCRALPFLYVLQEKMQCTVLFVNNLLSMSTWSSISAQTVYIPATVACLKSATSWGVTVNELIPGQRSVEENCLMPTCCCGQNAHYILLQMWIESVDSQEFSLCTQQAGSSIQKISLWKH